MNKCLILAGLCIITLSGLTVSAETIQDNSGNVYNHAEVVMLSPTHLFISYEQNGKTLVTGLRFENLPEDMQKKYEYSPAKAQQYRDEMARRETARKMSISVVPPNTVMTSRGRSVNGANQTVQQEPKEVQSLEWQIIESEHFRVFYKGSAVFAGKVSKFAEETFEGIRKRLNFTKTNDFWIWGNRVKIYIYSSQKEMVRVYNLPDWAAGCANYPQREISMVNTEYALRTIVSHELGHMVFFDTFGQWNALPWIAEGVARWLEPEESKAQWRRMCAKMKHDNLLFSLSDLTIRKDFKGLKDNQVQVFYCESMSVAEYLINISDVEVFKLFLTNLRNGGTLEGAIALCYGSKFANLSGLEEAWKASLGEAR